MAARKHNYSSSIMEHSLLCSDGLRLAAQIWTKGKYNDNDKQIDEGGTTATSSSSTSATISRKHQQKRVLCLHGFLDNCRSFHLLAPELVKEANAEQVVALDFPGHGLSSHKAPDAPSVLLSEYCFYVAEAVQQLQWDQFVLVGHSMGAAVSMIYAACFPEQVSQLVLLEGGQPLTRKVEGTSKYLRGHIEKRMKGNLHLYGGDGENNKSNDRNKSLSVSRLYPNLDQAVATRQKTATFSPGNQYLSDEAAREMVLRATVSDENGGVRFRHDKRLQWPSLSYFLDIQVMSLLESAQQVESCVILADAGWPIDEKNLIQMRERLKPKVWETLPGSHHFHADPASAEAVARTVVSFLNSSE